MSQALSIDIPQLRALLRSTADAIRTTKQLLRRRWTRPMYAEQKELVALKANATLLCVLRAYCRGKHHHQKPPRSLGPAPWDPEQFHQDRARFAADKFRLHAPVVPVIMEHTER